MPPRMPVGLSEVDWLDSITAHYIADRASLTPLPDAVETVAALAARGVPQCCVSNSHRQIVEANLDALGLAGYMAFTVSFDDVSAGKPDPEPFRRATARFGLDPAAVLAVEDSRTGVQSAVSAGLPVALCTAVAGAWPATVVRVERLAELLAWFEPERGHAARSPGRSP